MIHTTIPVPVSLFEFGHQLLFIKRMRTLLTTAYMGNAKNMRVYRKFLLSFCTSSGVDHIECQQKLTIMAFSVGVPQSDEKYTLNFIRRARV